MKLRTLKDMECGCSCDCLGDLREEAIKWIKHMKKREPFGKNADVWIKHFFNITKEELKGMSSMGMNIKPYAEEELKK